MPSFGTSWRPARSMEAAVKLEGRLDEVRTALQIQDPVQVAVRSGASFLTLGLGRGEIHIPFWGIVCILAWPGLTGFDNQAEPLTEFEIAFLLYHLLAADGTPVSGKWVSFADLPGRSVIDITFQGYGGNEVAKTFGANLESFRQACHSSGGHDTGIASTSFIFNPLPQVPMMISYRLGENDFPSSCQILFDVSVTHYLSIDACSILETMLAQQLLHSYHSMNK